MGRKVVLMQKPVELQVRFKDAEGTPIAIPGYNWTIYLYADKESRGFAVVHVGGALRMEGHVAEGSSLRLSDDGCGFIVKCPMLAMGDGGLRLKAVTRMWPGNEIGSAVNQCSDAVVLSMGHRCKLPTDTEYVDSVVLEVVERDVDWVLMSETDDVIITEDGLHFIDMKAVLRTL